MKTAGFQTSTRPLKQQDSYIEHQDVYAKQEELFSVSSSAETAGAPAPGGKSPG